METLSETKYNKGKDKYAFIEFPSAKIYKESTGNSWNNDLLFGDYVKIFDETIKNNRVYARCRNKNGWINVSDLRKDRVLEVNFVDIGQGDGCHVVTPDDKHIIIDAGKSDNMVRYLTWRFNLHRKTIPLDFPIHIVISHSDSDHYQGFSYVFDEEKIKVAHVFHNGLVERPGPHPLGKTENGYITGLVNDTTQMKEVITEASNRKGSGSSYCKTMYKSLKYSPDVEFKALSRHDDHIGEFEFQNPVNHNTFSIKVLAPIRNQINDSLGLKTIHNLGKDKNGHSVILKLIYGHARVLLGGDVNEEFGKILHDFYREKESLDELEVDVAKACHHGSNHFNYDFIHSINALGTVISSGDDESYSHPRPDAIGAFGKCGYGEKPLIFSTELARSNKDITHKNILLLTKKFNQISELKTELKTEANPDKVATITKKISTLNKAINSYLTRYGMINLRTDGDKMIIAQKYEKPSAQGKWDIHELEYSPASGRFELVED